MADHAVRVVELRGSTIVPGLIDLHVHSTFPSEMPVYLWRRETASATPHRPRVVADHPDRVAADDPVGPRLFQPGPMFEPAGPVSSPASVAACVGPEDAARAAADLIDAEGADRADRGAAAGPEVCAPCVAHRPRAQAAGEQVNCGGRRPRRPRHGIDQVDNAPPDRCQPRGQQQPVLRVPLRISKRIDAALRQPLADVTGIEQHR